MTTLEQTHLYAEALNPDDRYEYLERLGMLRDGEGRVMNAPHPLEPWMHEIAKKQIADKNNKPKPK